MKREGKVVERPIIKANKSIRANTQPTPIVWKLGSILGRQVKKSGDYYSQVNEKKGEIGIPQSAYETDPETILLCIDYPEKWYNEDHKLVWIDKRKRTVRKETSLNHLAETGKTKINHARPFPFEGNAYITSWYNPANAIVVDEEGNELWRSPDQPEAVKDAVPLVKEGVSHTQGDVLLCLSDGTVRKYSYPGKDLLWEYDNGASADGLFELGTTQSYGGDYLIISEGDNKVVEVKEEDKSTQWSYGGTAGLGTGRLYLPEAAVRVKGIETTDAGGRLTLITSFGRIVGVTREKHVNFQIGAPVGGTYYAWGDNWRPSSLLFGELDMIDITSRGNILICDRRGQSLYEFVLEERRDQSPSIQFFTDKSASADTDYTSRKVDIRFSEHPTITILDTEDASYDVQVGMVKNTGDNVGDIDWFVYDSGLSLSSFTDPETGNTHYKDTYPFSSSHYDYVRIVLHQGGTAGTVNAWLGRERIINRRKVY